MSSMVTTAGTLIEQWDDDTRTVRRWQATQLIEERPYTPGEAAPLDNIVAADLARQRCAHVLDTLAAALATDEDYLALAAPSAAQRAAQVDALTRQVAGLIRFATNRLAP